MKQFDVIMGNPPYTSKPQRNIFQTFTYQALTKAKTVLFAVPCSWFVTNGAGNKLFRTTLRGSNLRQVTLVDESVFAGIRSPVCWFRTGPGEGLFVDNSKDVFKVTTPDFIFKQDIIQTIVNKVGCDNHTLYNFISTDEPDKWRIAITYQGSGDHVDKSFILPPGEPLKKGFVQSACKDEYHAQCILSVLQSKLARFMYVNTRTSKGCMTRLMPRFVPYLDDKIYDDQEIYKHFKLTPQEIQAVHDR